MVCPDDFDGHYVEENKHAQTLQTIAEQWVRGREIDLLGARVVQIVENAIGTEYLTVEAWREDPEAWAEELQLYAADTLETIPIATLIGLIEGYAAEALG